MTDVSAGLRELLVLAGALSALWSKHCGDKQSCSTSTCRDASSTLQRVLVLELPVLRRHEAEDDLLVPPIRSMSNGQRVARRDSWNSARLKTRVD